MVPCSVGLLKMSVVCILPVYLCRLMVLYLFVFKKSFWRLYITVFKVPVTSVSVWHSCCMLSSVSVFYIQCLTLAGVDCVSCLQWWTHWCIFQHCQTHLDKEQNKYNCYRVTGEEVQYQFNVTGTKQHVHAVIFMCLGSQFFIFGSSMSSCSVYI